MPTQRLEQILAQAAHDVAYPPTPALTDRVHAAIAGDLPPARPARQARLRMAYAALAVASLTFGIALAISPSRTAIADFFGLLDGEQVEFLPDVESGEALPPPVSVPEIAVPAPLEAAADLAGFPLALPAGQGEPRAVYFIEAYLRQAFGVAGSTVVVVLEYERFDLWQTRGPGYFVKGVPFDVRIATTEVNDAPAYWIESEGHTLRLVDADGTTVPGSQRTVIRNVLIWRGAETHYRLEGDLTRSQALVIARSLP